MEQKILENYAKLIVRSGLNVQEGQEVIIRAELDQPEFVSMTVEECYRVGAKKVTVEWTHQAITGIHTKYQSTETLGKVEKWEEEKLRHQAEILPCELYLMSEDPDGLADADQEKMARARQMKYPVIKPYKDQMENKQQWCIAAVPGRAWAKKVFPELPEEERMEKLWEAILFASRALEDPMKAWREHDADLKKRCEYLNSLGLVQLEYHAGNGTDLRVGLIEDALFLGANERTLRGIDFNANIPSEEVFTSPKRGEAEGIVFASKPLSYQGQLIEDFWIHFENGRVSEVHAEKNEALLRKLIAMDESAAYLGECALVPYRSPISDLGITFYNTLFDENAACHLALGMGFTNCIRDYDKYTLEECRAKGVNDSILHEDFMIGTKDLSIIGRTKDGREVEIFRDGGWAF